MDSVRAGPFGQLSGPANFVSGQTGAGDCTGRSDCLSFEWSPQTKIGSLNRAAEPTMGHFEDYTFGRRLPAALAPAAPTPAALAVAVPAAPPPAVAAPIPPRTDEAPAATDGRRAEKTYADAERFSAGWYKILYYAMPVNSAPERTSKKVGTVRMDHFVKVLEISDKLY
eukprot:CAMPEP_0168490410 /NCGR_PEP_ID=MMETSP0228-20121227/69172_1 /TAXON_ID=133427 /ORGANISM="Protoceratium reticulatum, Strain CCCM 535 (=CCMP 1889)" /LENGTH=168 /DNA_ID=CAMNT_0008507127 /DNA_START=13 /DNA_END=516 /DNA_ORIENTATION=-